MNDEKTGRHVETVTKVKGFRLSYQSSAHINFKRMKKQVISFVKCGKIDQVTLYNDQIQRTKLHKIVTAPTSKVQKVVYKKRVVRPDYTTIPFGYVNEV